MVITLSILNGFSKFFHCWKETKISNKIHIMLPTIPSVCCHNTLRKLEVRICGNFQNKNNLKIVLHLTKTETSLVIWLNIVTRVAQSVHLLPAHTCEDVHTTHQLHCQLEINMHHLRGNAKPAGPLNDFFIQN